MWDKQKPILPIINMGIVLPNETLCRRPKIKYWVMTVINGNVCCMN